MNAHRWDPLSLDETARLFDGFPGRWWIAGGHAIELFVGRRLRDHGDIDVLVPRKDQEALRAQLADWDLRVAHDGRLEPWRRDAYLELPRHSVWARRAEDEAWRLQLLFAETGQGEWWSRRDAAIRLPLDDIGLVSPEGIPYVRPELILLFKAKEPRGRDELDFAAALPGLDDGARERFRAWLPPAHPWRARLERNPIRGGPVNDL